MTAPSALIEKIELAVVSLVARLLPRRWMCSKRFFHLWERQGYHVTPCHFHEPVPDTRDLGPELWTKQSDLVGIDLNEAAQLRLLEEFSSRYKSEYQNLPREKTSAAQQYYLNNGFFESVDGEILYCMIRHFKPRRIFEIGSGNSTYLSAQAVRENGRPCELVAFEPHPETALRAGVPEPSRLVRTKVQDVPVQEFERLEENDILFIDSSHVLTIGSDVQVEILEILPRLKKGVLVHLHDVFIPSEYPKSWVLENHLFWTEQYLLQAFLTFNNAFEVLWAASYMHLKHPDVLEQHFSSYQRQDRWPGSFWMRKKT